MMVGNNEHCLMSVDKDEHDLIVAGENRVRRLLIVEGRWLEYRDTSVCRVWLDSRTETILEHKHLAEGIVNPNVQLSRNHCGFASHTSVSYSRVSYHAGGQWRNPPAPNH
jgi:hypothetical protein